MKQGWVKLHRKLLDNPVLQNDKTAKLLFVDLLLLVNEDGKYKTGRFQLAEITGIKPTTLYKALIRLESTGMVTLTSNNKYTTISICKWKSYQQTSNSTDNNKVTTKGQQSNNKVTLTKNKRIENRENTTNVVLAEPESFGNADINELFAYWKEMTGNAITSNVTKNRYAAKNLLKKHGMENLKRMIGGVAYSHGERYAPSIANFIQLQAKWDELVVWGKKHKTAKSAGRGFTVT